MVEKRETTPSAASASARYRIPRSRSRGRQGLVRLRKAAPRCRSWRDSSAESDARRRGCASCRARKFQGCRESTRELAAAQRQFRDCLRLWATTLRDQVRENGLPLGARERHKEKLKSAFCVIKSHRGILYHLEPNFACPLLLLSATQTWREHSVCANIIKSSSVGKSPTAA